MQSEIELKPCPFCGGTAWVYPTEYGWAAKCESCLSEGADKETREEAADAWNRRAEPEKRHGHWEKGGYACGETEWKCSVCRETEWRTSCNRMKFCMFCGAKMDAKEEEAAGTPWEEEKGGSET